MKKRKIIVSLLLSLILLCTAVMPAFAAGTETDVCLHENAEWKLSFPATPVTNAYYSRTCPDCGFSQTAQKARSSWTVAVFDRLLGLFFPTPKGGLPESFTVTAHTGPGEIPMNSKFSLWYQLRSGADVVEFDIALNSDGVAVLTHSDPAEAEMTLEEAFAMVAKYTDIQVNMDIKDVAAVASAQELAIKYGILDRVFCTGFYSAAYMKEHCPLVPFYKNASCSSDPAECARLCDEAVSEGAIGLNFDYTNCSEELVAAAHERGLLVSLYTVNRPSEQLSCLACGVDNITTEFPFVLYLLSGKSNPLF